MEPAAGHMRWGEGRMGTRVARHHDGLAPCKATAAANRLPQGTFVVRGVWGPGVPARTNAGRDQQEARNRGLARKLPIS